MPSPRFAFAGSPASASPWLLQALARVGTLEAVCGENAEADAKRYHARWAFSSLCDLLNEAEPDGVVLEHSCGERPRLIKQCLSGGAAVLLTGAPGPATTCKRLTTFAKLAGRFVLAATPLRYAPSILLARRLLDSGKFREPVSMRLESTWRGSSRSKGDPVGAVPSDQVFEATDLAYHLLGPIGRVFSVAHAEGAVVASGELASGVPLSMVFHACGPAEAVGLSLEIRASDGAQLRLDRDLRLTCRSGSRVDAAHSAGLATVDPVLELGYEGLAADFRRYLQASRPGLGLVGPVASVASCAEAILASAARGRPVVPKVIATGDEARGGLRRTRPKETVGEVGA